MTSVAFGSLMNENGFLSAKSAAAQAELYTKMIVSNSSLKGAAMSLSF